MTFPDDVISQLDVLHVKGLYKHGEPFTTAQAAHVGILAGSVINLCANNYPGLMDSPELIAAAKGALERWSFDMASVRLICDTQTQYLDLKAELTRFLWSGAEGFDIILYSSCFDVSGGLFETSFETEDAIISDELNHAPIIDGMRLSGAVRHRYRNRDLSDLYARLGETRGTRHRVIATDGVFSMNGYVAPLDEIRASVDEYDALMIVGDSYTVGFVGKAGVGVPERFGVAECANVTTGTLGKALGGASGGYTCVRSPVVELLRQQSRPYLFSNSLVPPTVAVTLTALGLLGRSGELLDRLCESTIYFRTRMAKEGFGIPESDHPIAPVAIGDAVLVARAADAILAHGVYAWAFSYPVIPKGRVKIQTQLSASFIRNDLDTVIRAFVKARSEVQ